MSSSVPPLAASSDLPSFLFGAEGLRELGRLLESSGVADQVTSTATGLSNSARKAVRARLADALAPLLDVDLASIVVRGWASATKLRSAGDLTRNDPTRSEFVELAKHTISTSRKPRADLVIAEKVVAHLELELSISLEVECATATVAHGRLLALTAGRCEAAVTLSVGGKQVATRKAPVDLQFEVSLKDGVPIVPGEKPLLVQLPEQDHARADSVS
jgi:hypothetical protein